MKHADILTVHGLKLRGQIGSTAEERAFAQPLVVDLELELDLRPAAQSGDLAATVCWSLVAGCVEKTVAERARVLVEELAEDTATALLRLDSRIAATRVTVKKFPFPHAEWVAITVQRNRNECLKS